MHVVVTIKRKSKNQGPTINTSSRRIYTRQQNREFVVTCNKCNLLNKNRHILVIHYQPQRNEIPYMVETVPESQRHIIRNSL